MKKIIFSILALILLTGCSINVNVGTNEKSSTECENKLPNYVLSNMNYLDTLEKNIKLNGSDHKLTFIYSYGLVRQYDNFQKNWMNVLYVTVLLDDKTISNELTNKIIYNQNYTDYDPSRDSLDTAYKISNEEWKNIIESYHNDIDIIQDNTGKEFILYTQQRNESWTTHYDIYLITNDNRVLYNHSITANFNIKDSAGNYIVGYENNEGNIDAYLTISQDKFITADRTRKETISLVNGDISVLSEGYGNDKTVVEFGF